MTAPSTDPAAKSLAPASLRARLACMVYEAMLLFAIVFSATLLFSVLLEQRHALSLRGALQDWLFVVLALYFGWFWTHGGQTLAMKTWQIRVVDKHGATLSWPRALLRYALAWCWFVPGLALAWVGDATEWMLVLVPALNALLWALAVFLHADRQFLHDRLAGSRLVVQPLSAKKVAGS